MQENGLDMPPSVQSIIEALDETNPNLGWNLYNIFPEMTTAPPAAAALTVRGKAKKSGDDNVEDEDQPGRCQALPPDG
jgi:hypothetical protein